MNAADFERVFGRGRVRMVTGAHVEVFREEAQTGERRRYTKRFLATEDGDYREWTEREWRILARLVGHGSPAVPDIVQFDRGLAGGAAQVQTYDAGITVDHWATLLPVERDGTPRRHLYEDCAHWWALAHHCLAGLDAIHALDVVHLDLKADNVCIPLAPDDFDARLTGATLRPHFEQLAFIDFAFSLVSGEPLKTALPIARQHDYEYQSPRLLHALDEGRRGNLVPTQQLDWRCDVYSLAAMLRRYLPDPERQLGTGWTASRNFAARALVRALLQAHDEGALLRPHRAWIETTSSVLAEEDLAESLQRGWCLASNAADAGADQPTPITRIAQPLPLAQVSAWKAAGAKPRRRAVAWGSALFAATALAVPALDNLWRSADDERLAPTQPARSAQAAASAVSGPAAAEVVERSVAAVAPPAPDAPARSAAAPTGEAPAASPTRDVPAAPPTRDAPAASPTGDAPAPSPTRAATARTAALTSRARLSTPAAAAAPNPKVAAATPRGPIGARSLVSAARTPGRSATLAARSAQQPGRSAAVKAAVTAHRFPPVPNDGALLPRAPTPAPTSLAAAPPASPALPPRTVELLAREGNTAETLGVRYAPPSETIDFNASAATLMATHVPRIAQRAGRMVRRVLFLAAHAEDGRAIDDIRSAASEVVIGARDPLFSTDWAAPDARRLSEEARVERTRGNAARTLHLQTQAFGANPGDPEIAGNLAALYVRLRPSNAATARDLALLALALHDRQHPLGRIEDWTTLAIANALAGRYDESRDAWIASLALAPRAGRQCRAAIDAYGIYGERLRAPVEAMLQRGHQWSAGEPSAFCDWAPRWLGNGSPR
ncbi:MAG: hypothetical protein ACJ8G7_21665 [Rhizobacter sp.]